MNNLEIKFYYDNDRKNKKTRLKETNKPKYLNKNINIKKFDFNDKENWNKCLVLLKSNKGKNIIKFAIKRHIETKIWMELQELNIETTLKSLKYAKKTTTNPYNIYNSNEFPSYYNNSIHSLFMNINIDNEKEEDRLFNYQISHACHNYGAIINLYLATNIFPNEKWGLLSNEYHTCVVNNYNSDLLPTTLFDILYPSKEINSYIWATDIKQFNILTADYIMIPNIKYLKRIRENIENSI
jgi:hypothetical protein